MVKPEIIESRPITVAELKSEIQSLKKRDGELNYRAQKTEEYVQSLKPMKISQAKEIYEKLDALKIPRLKDSLIIKFIDIMPISVEDAKLVIQGQSVSINNDNLKKIVDVLDGFR